MSFNKVEICNVDTSSLTTLTEEEKQHITDVIVLGGANDWSKTYEEIRTGIESFSILCNENFPAAKKWLFMAGWSFDTNIRNGLKMSYYYYSRLAVRYGGFTVINDIFKGLHNKNRMSDDEVHPNADGQEQIGVAVANVLNGGSPESQMPVEHYVFFNGEIIGRAILNCNVIDVRLFCKTVALPESVDITGSLSEVCSFESDIILGSDINAS